MKSLVLDKKVKVNKFGNWSLSIIGATLVGGVAAFCLAPTASADCMDCTGTADCTSGCIAVNAGMILGWICATVHASPNPGKVCAKAAPGKTCSNNASVICGKGGDKKCSGPPTAPDCSGIVPNHDIMGDGCVN